MIKFDLETLKTRLNLYLCPILLGASVCYATIYSLYQPSAILYTLIFFFAEVLLYIVFDNIKTKKILCPIIYGGMLILSWAASLSLTAIGTRLNKDWMAFMMWFLGSANIDENQPFFLNAVFIGGGFFLTSILYYFTQIRYRSPNIMLCILFPFVIYARRNEAMEEIMITIIVSLYLAVIIHNRMFDPAKPANQKVKLKLDRSYIISIALFVAVTGMITMMIDRPAYRSLLERNLNSTRFGNIGNTEIGGGRSSGDDFSYTSTPRYNSRDFTDDPLFYLKTDSTDDILYLRRQTFASFNGDVWEIDRNSIDQKHLYYNGVYDQSNENVMLFVKEIQRKINSDDTPKKPELSHYYTGYVYSDSYSPIILPAPFGAYPDEEGSNKIQYQPLEDMTFYRYASGGNVLNKLDDTFTYVPQSSAYEYAASLGFTEEDYLDLLSQAPDYISKSLIADLESARSKYTSTDNISQEVSELAHRITADCYSDLEKALVLTEYFSLNNYVYDDEYEPEDKSIDYFIFEGKTGVCTSYATAMTLMARSIGLPARYVEGYAAFEKDGDRFIIRDSYAHAFVEIYIPGTGWLTFDPTVADYREKPERSKFKDILPKLIKILSRIAVMLTVTVLIFLFLLKDRIIERFFRFTQVFRNPKQKTLKLYSNLVKVVGLSTNSDYHTYTVGNMHTYLLDNRGTSPEQLLQLFEKTAYGGYTPTEDDYKKAYKEYKKCYKYIRKPPKKSTNK